MRDAKGQFNSRQLRSALGLYVTGVAVVAAAYGERRSGITINSFSSVSLDPPLVLFSVARALTSFPVFAAANGFTINVLREDQGPLAAQFARGGDDKWRGVEAVPGLHGGWLLHPCLASFDCRTYQRYEGGDHLIIVGEVCALSADASVPPLVYFRSNYQQLAEAAASVAYGF